MFALVKYQDGVKKIVPTSDIKHFDADNVNLKKKYKIKWKDDEFYDGVIIIVGETEKEIHDKDASKRHRITPFEMCDSADDTDASMVEKTNNMNDNTSNEKIKNILTKKVEKVQINLHKFVLQAQDGTKPTANADSVHDVQKPLNGDPISSTTGAIKKTTSKIAQTKKQTHGKLSAKIDKMTTKKSTASLTKGLVATKNSGSKPTVNSVVKTAEGKPTAHKHRQNSSAETAPTEANIVHSVVRKTADHDESQEAEAESVVLSNKQYKPTGPSVIKAVEEKSTTHKQQRNSSAKSEAQPEANVIASSVHTVVGKTAHHDESRKARAETVTLSNKQCKNNVDCNLCTSLTKKMEDAFNQIKKLEKKEQETTSHAKKWKRRRKTLPLN